MTDKQQVKALLDRLPDNVSLDAIQDEIRLLAGIRVAEQQSQDGQLIDHEAVKNELQTWISK
jgi:hypothetical protein